MAWNDELQEAFYNAPDGTRAKFSYENVRKHFDKRTVGFEFPGKDGTYVQDIGNSGYKFPLLVYFWGDDYNTEAEAFLSLLEQSGVGKLEHPIYGTVDVVPTGRIIRRDNLVTAANQAVIEVTFLQTLQIVLPSTDVSPKTQVEAKITECTDAAAEQTKQDISIDTSSESADFATKLKEYTTTIKGKMTEVSDSVDSVQKEFNAIVDSIDNSVDVLIGDPIAMGYQVVALLQSPSRAITSFQVKFDSYVNLISDLIASDLTPTLDNKASNEYALASLNLTGAMLGVVNSALVSDFKTRPQALEAAENILLKSDEVTVWKDANTTALSLVDTGEMYQKLQEAVALVAGFLVQISFTLKQERHIITTKPHSILDLCAQLYGQVDEVLDFFISSNDFSGDELLEIPAGRRVVYYT